ncbi:MAG: glycosyltransferase family 4 protein [Spirochaetes bacterium]|nr:glycosyltransferase family 4 protein [Spirochaetota bacterium]
MCSDYSGTPLYEKMVSQIDNESYQQIVYVPTRIKEFINKYKNEELLNVEYHYPYILNLYTRINYLHKVKKIYKNIEDLISMKEVGLIHAHFLFSDGGVAYKLNKNYNIDYIVAVRDTDVNIFFKYLLYIKRYGIEILNKAKKIIFISPAYKEFVINNIIPKDKRKEIEEKSLIIPNGVDKFWLNNRQFKKVDKKNFNLIFIGQFIKRKNIYTSIKVSKKLKKMGYNVNFTIIGMGKLERKIKEISYKINDIIQIHNHINDPKELLSMYRKSDIFIMPSFRETFGLSYIEAMSQGLPVIYSKGQGIDGYFNDGEIGFAVEPKNVDEIVNKILIINSNYNEISKNCYNRSAFFSWKRIIEEYIKLYKKYCSAE